MSNYEEVKNEETKNEEVKNEASSKKEILEKNYIESISKPADFKNKKTSGYLISKANYTISINYNGKNYFIPPFGKLACIKEALSFNKNDAKYLTFIKL